MQRKILILPFVLAGCADTLFVSNVPDYLQNNDQARIVVLTGDKNALGASKPAPTEDGDFPMEVEYDNEPITEPTELDAPEQIWTEVPAQDEKGKPAAGKAPAKVKTENESSAAPGQYTIEEDDEKDNAAASPATIEKSAKKSEKSEKNTAESAKKSTDDSAPKAAPAAGSKAKKPSAKSSKSTKNAPAASKPQKSVLSEYGAVPDGVAVASKASAPKKSRAGAPASTAAGGKCQKGEKLTKMKSGAYACCPNGGDVCYALGGPAAAAPTPAKTTRAAPAPGCRANESWTKMSGGVYACCPDGGDVCYSLCRPNETLTEMSGGGFACCPAGRDVCHPVIK